MATGFRKRSCSNKEVERDDASKRSHRAIEERRLAASGGGPAQRAKLRTGDVVLAVGGMEVRGLAALFRRIWSLGHAGVEVPLLVYRDGRTFELRIASGDRNRFLKGPSLH